jgi:hypothetical protein
MLQIKKDIFCLKNDTSKKKRISTKTNIFDLRELFCCIQTNINPTHFMNKMWLIN